MARTDVAFSMGPERQLVTPIAYQWRLHWLDASRRNSGMIALVSLLSLIGGATLAYASERYPAHVAALETGGGILMIAGLALVGAGIPQA